MHIFPGYVAASICLSSTLRFSENNIINDVSNYHNLSLQFMTEMKETAFIMQNVTSKYVFSTVFFSLKHAGDLYIFVLKRTLLKIGV